MVEVRNKGFSLVELMVVLAILAILSVLIPGFYGRTIVRGCVTNTANDMVTAVAAAQGEALKLRRVFVVAPLQGQNWNGPGFNIFEGTAQTNIFRTYDNNCTGRVNITVQANGAAVNAIRVQASGVIIPPAFVYKICGAGNNFGRQLTFSTLGRAIAEDVTCP